MSRKRRIARRREKCVNMHVYLLHFVDAEGELRADRFQHAAGVHDAVAGLHESNAPHALRDVMRETFKIAQ